MYRRTASTVYIQVDKMLNNDSCYFVQLAIWNWIKNKLIIQFMFQKKFCIGRYINDLLTDWNAMFIMATTTETPKHNYTGKWNLQN